MQHVHALSATVGVAVCSAIQRSHCSTPALLLARNACSPRADQGRFSPPTNSKLQWYDQRAFVCFLEPMAAKIGAMSAWELVLAALVQDGALMGCLGTSQKFMVRSSSFCSFLNLHLVRPLFARRLQHHAVISASQISALGWCRKL